MLSVMFQTSLVELRTGIMFFREVWLRDNPPPAGRPPSLTFSTSIFDLHLPLRVPLTGTYFGSSASPKMDLSRSVLWVMALGVYGTRFPTVHCPLLLTRPPSLSLGIYFLSSRTRALNYECTIITTSPCLSPSTLDGSCFPRRDVGVTREIPQGWWMAYTELQTLDE
jgi:hypothetical protein